MKTGSALFIGAEPVFYLKVFVCNGGLIMFHHKKINIAITFHWGGTYNSIWSNGAGQNMFFLKQCLESIDFVNEVYFVYWGLDTNLWDDIVKDQDVQVALYSWEEVVHTTDILIEGTLLLEQKYVDAFRKHGAKIVSYRMGNDLISLMEHFVNNSDGGRTINGITYDAIWVLPHHMNTNYSYLSIMYEAPVHQVPYLWSPHFLERALDYFDVRHIFGYTSQNKGAKRVSVMEPNISVLKNCLVPVLIAELAYKRLAHELAHVYLCNTVDKKDLKGFFNFIGHTQLVKDNVMTVEERFITPYFLAHYTDIILSFQWENGMNNFYLEVLYGGYPLIHNSAFLRKNNVGFYYEGFNAYEGAEALIQTIYSYDEQFDYHTHNNQAFIQSMLPTAQNNITDYRFLLEQLYK